MNTGETIALIKAFGNGGGGGGLPAVTSADNGKVLAVKDGAWAADANIFVITASGTTINKTVNEITAALDAGMTVLLENETTGKTYLYSGQDSLRIYFASLTNAQYFVFYITKATGACTSTSNPPLPIAPNAGYILAATGVAKWQAVKKKFTVTLTPTAQDFSGTMDKTPAEITAAYGAGQEIVFDIPSMSARIHATQFLVVNDVIIAGGMVFYDVNNSPVIITIATDSSASTYATQVFATTPAS